MKHGGALRVPGLPDWGRHDTIILWVHPELVRCKIDCGDSPDILTGSPCVSTGSEIILRDNNELWRYEEIHFELRNGEAVLHENC